MQIFVMSASLPCAVTLITKILAFQYIYLFIYLFIYLNFVFTQSYFCIFVYGLPIITLGVS